MEQLDIKTFIKAVQQNNIDFVKDVLNNPGQRIQIINGKYNNALQRNALMVASFEGHLGIVQLLLDNGAEVNDVDSTGMTALMLAAEQGDLEIVKILLLKGANIDNKTTVGPPQNALEIAREHHHDDVAEVLDKWDETKAMIPLEEMSVLNKLDPTSFIDMKEYNKGKGGKRKKSTKRKKRSKKRKQTKRKQTKKRRV